MGSRRNCLSGKRKETISLTISAFVLVLMVGLFDPKRNLGQNHVFPRRAFLTMLCSTHESTFDDESGIGSEFSTLVHGWATKMQHANVAGVENVLLHIVVGQCRQNLILARELNLVYDRVIVVDDNHQVSKALAGYKWQPHLWFKLVSFGLTEYDRVLWNGFDTLPVARMDSLFEECKSPPCLDDEGNADLVVIEPNSTALEMMLAELKSHPDFWDGRPQYDMGFLYHFYRERNIVGTISPAMDGYNFDAPRNETIKTIHFTGWNKPYFQMYCRRLPDGALLKTAPGDEGPLIHPKGSPGSKMWCWDDPLRHLLHVKWWIIALQMELAVNMTKSIVAQYITPDDLVRKCVMVHHAIGKEIPDSVTKVTENPVLPVAIETVSALMQVEWSLRSRRLRELNFP